MPVDFAVVREALRLPRPTPTTILDRGEVFSAHLALIAREKEAELGEPRTRTAFVGPGKAFSARELDELQSVSLKDLKCDDTARGKALVCRIAARCVRTVSVQTVVEMEDTLVAPLQLHHHPQRKGEVLDDLFPVDAYFAIKEPSLRSTHDGFTIRIDSPSDFIQLLPSHPLLATAKFPPPRQLPVVYRDAKWLRDEGNSFYAKKKFAAAAWKYSLAIDASTPSTAPQDTYAALANRAACALHSRPNAALRDALEALKFDCPLSMQLKLYYRAATACYEMHRFSEAKVYLRQMQELEPASKEAQDLLDCVERGLEQVAGLYDWPALFATARNHPGPLKVGEIVGDMFEVKNVKGKGRGLVATRRIEPGELLMVQKPFAVSTGDRTRKTFVAGANLYTETMDAYTVGDLVAHLVERMMDDAAVRCRVLDLYAGDEALQHPVTKTGIDISRVEAVVTYNAFHVECLTTKMKGRSPADDAADNVHAPTALYGLPSMLNHSCLGNVSYSFLSDVLFMRCRLPIEPGEELVDSYTDSLASLQKRRQALDKHGFVCACELCRYDLEDGVDLCARREELSTQLEDLTDRIHGSRQESSDKHAALVEKLTLQLDATHKATRPKLRPAMYAAWRLQSATLSSMSRFEESIRTEVEALEALGAVLRWRSGATPQTDAPELLQVPRVGDVNAVLSCLFIAEQLSEIGKHQASKSWSHDIARRIEKGQAGEALMESRYDLWKANADAVGVR